MTWRLSCSVVLWMVLTASPVRAADDAKPQGRAFPILASTYAVLSGLDVYTTTRAVQSGAGVEANPLVGPAAGNVVALSALKAASTTTTIYLARKLWKQHPKRAIVLLVCANVGMSFVVTHNAAVIR